MSFAPVTVRCPACGQGLRVVLAARPSTQWFPCPNCRRPVPVVLPRTPPPLYSWEVVHGLYPSFPLPRRPRVRPSRVAAAGLVAVAVVAFALLGTLAWYAGQANVPGTFTVSGALRVSSAGGGPHSVAGVVVHLDGEGGYRAAATVGPSGAFRFGGVPGGGVTLTVNDPSFAKATLLTFVSSVYDAGSTGLVLTLHAAPSGNATRVVLTPYESMESFLSNLLGAAALFGLAGALAGFAAASVRRPGGAVLGVLGGGAGIGIPAVGVAVALATPFPLVALATIAAGAAGAFVVTLEAAALARTTGSSTASG